MRFPEESTKYVPKTAPGAPLKLPIATPLGELVGKLRIEEVAGQAGGGGMAT